MRSVNIPVHRHMTAHMPNWIRISVERDNQILYEVTIIILSKDVNVKSNKPGIVLVCNYIIIILILVQRNAF